MGIDHVASPDARPGRQNSDRTQTRRRRERGQSMVEFAVVIPVFVVVVLGIIDFGMALRADIMLTNAAREGARVGVVCEGDDTTTASNAAIAQVVDSGSALGLTAANVIQATTPCSTGSEVVVTAQYTYNFITPLGGIVRILGGSDSITFTSTTRMRSE